MLSVFTVFYKCLTLRVSTSQVLFIIIGERAKRARRYLVMFMETRDIYIYIYVRLFLIPMRAFSLGYPDPPSVLACEFNSRARKRNDFLA